MIFHPRPPLYREHDARRGRPLRCGPPVPGAPLPLPRHSVRWGAPPSRCPSTAGALLLLAITLFLLSPTALATGGGSGGTAVAIWQAVGPGDPVSVVSLLADPEDGRTLYLGTERGVLVSRDAGASWEMSALPGLRALALHPRMPQRLVAVTQPHARRFQVWRSDDRGRTWSPRSEVAGPSDRRVSYDLLTLALDPEAPEAVFVGGQVRDTVRDGSQNPAGTAPASRGTAPGPARPETVAPPTLRGTPARGRVWRSDDGGETLVELAGPRDLTSLELAPLDLVVDRRGTLYAATVRGVFRSSDRGARWQEARSGLETEGSPLPIHRLALAGGATAGPAATSRTPEVLYAAADGTGIGIYRSDDGGDHWSAVETVPPGPVLALALDRRDRRSLFASIGEDGVHGTRGGAWQPVRPALPEDAVVVGLAMLGNTLYAATADGEVFRRGAPPPACVDDATTLCLGDRFRVELEWWTGDGRVGTGQAVPLTRAAGWFWTDDRQAPEVAVKVLEGRDPEGPWRVYHSALSDVGLDLRVFDVVTGHFQVHRRSPGDEAGAAGAMAFPPAPEDAAAADEVWFASLPEGGCGGDSIDLCLEDGRFEVAVDWRDGEGQEGAAVADRLSPTAGWFRFFQPGNPDLFVKLVDGGEDDGHRGVYFGALTDVAFTLRIRDRETGEERIYEVPPGEPMAHGDRRAFDTVPTLR